MDKGFFSNKTQEWVITKVKTLLKDQKPMLVLFIVLAIKAIFLYADDNLAESKVPTELTAKCREFFDALIDGNVDTTLVLGMDLVGIIYGLIKAKKDAEVIG